MNLLVVSHVPHARFPEGLMAYSPYVREVEMWADLFEEVRIAAPMSGVPGEDSERIRRSNVVLAPQPDVGAVAGLRRITRVAKAVITLSLQMMRSSAIHVRCPGNLGLLGVVLAPLFSRRIVAKYAGSWPNYPDEPFTYRLQKRVLRSWWWRGPVTVYGEWPGEPAKVTPFFTAAMDRAQLAAAAAVARSRSPLEQLRLLYVGRLTEAKNVDILIRAVSALQKEGISLTCMIAGDGPQAPELKRLVTELGVEDQVEFLGAVPLDEMPRVYSEADVLVLVSRSEGWPKAIAEAMAFGLVCVGTDQGFVPQMLGGGRGVCVPPGVPAALTQTLLELAGNPAHRAEMATLAAGWAQAFGVEDLREAIRDLLERAWKVRLQR